MESMTALGGEIHIESVAGSEALNRWKELRDKAQETGLYPLIVGQPVDMVGQPEDLEFIEVGQSAPWSLADVMAKATEEARAEFIEERRREAAEMAEEGVEYPERGEWPHEPGGMDDPNELAILRDLEGNLVESVLLAHVPGRSGAEAIGALGYGAWNECPHPHVHVAFFRHWEQRYGVELVVCASDMVECLVSRPPSTRDGAIELALEHFWYCADVVDQGAGTIEALANDLLNAPRWLFWWD